MLMTCDNTNMSLNQQDKTNRNLYCKDILLLLYVYISKNKLYDVMPSPVECPSCITNCYIVLS